MRQRSKNVLKVFNLSNQKHGAAVDCHEEDCRKSRFGGENQKFGLGHIESEMAIPCGEVD